ncbi:type 1 glutamine amidotransferase [Patulibacter sp. SYSU D01012]|uniref:type 1 glutamine amidotransferase n=1 Tax=Patulibacter sp. SYSU D01012 TaxID=2817381 RepID=UPI001B317505|nr:type 1 glutamine amidotransferase [Patulibacter sp. SYSU D01012]
MTPRALVLQHGDWGPPGLLADWAADRGVALDVHHAASGDPLPALDGQAFVASLGSPHNPDHAGEEVVAERAFVREAVARDVPMLGLCFGGQMLAAVLGGRIERAPRPEVAWHRIRSASPDEVPEGPWLQWHYDRFTLPPGAEPLADSPVGLQAFRHGRHLGVQFHPESTIEIVRDWARTDAPRLAALGIEDGEALLEQGRPYADAAADAAYVLFDAFWERARR